ncbi:STAS domain-containing protein [Actinocorallia libanotica]|uniref:Anti-sigma factor antagonist n=1 Tax=Actinocorallia libanotica TaxID=46162 RepID=A0ABN1RCL6_9ACTN
MPPSLGLASRYEDGYLIVAVSGELDIATAPELRAYLFGLLPTASAGLVLDLSGLSFCDSRGIGVLVWARAAVDSALAVVAPHRRIARLLQITGLSDVLRVNTTVPEALRALETRIDGAASRGAHASPLEPPTP